MPKVKKVKDFKFTSTQSDWLRKFFNGYKDLVKADPEDSENSWAPFFEGIFTELEEEFQISNVAPRDKVMEVGVFLIFNVPR